MPGYLMDRIEALVQEEVERRMDVLLGRMEPLTISEAAHRLGLADSTVYGMVRLGKITTIGNGTSRLLIPASEVDRLISGRAA
jgi:excisionase family DNA binding protein